MAFERARSPFLWLRRALLALGLLGLAALIVMLGAYRFGKSGQRAQERPRAVVEEGADTVESGKGFDHTQTNEGDPVFRIRAASSRQDRDNTAFLQDVLLDIFREDGQVYEIRSNKAVFNGDQDLAELEGDVVLSGWGELELKTRALELRNKGQVLTSSGEVEISYPPSFVGRGSRLRLDRREELITLGDGVHLQSVPGADIELRLDSERLAYRRDEGVIRATGDVFLRYGGHEVRSRALTIFLTEDGRTIQSLRARWDVNGRLQVGSEPSTATEITYRGGYLELQPDPSGSGHQSFRIEEEGDALVELAATDISGLTRRLVGRFLLGHLQGDQLVQVEGFGDPLVMREEVIGGEPQVLRSAQAERGTANFLADGRPAQIDLEGQVEIRDRVMQIKGGATGRLDLISGQVEIRGRAVELQNDRAEVIAPHFVYSRDSGLIRASEGVRAVLAESAVAALGNTPLGQGEGPIRVESQEALWTVEPPTFSFRGQVRAWRGQNLVLADQLRGDEQGKSLAASGAVKTLWVSPGAAGDTVLGADEPIEVTAERLTYRQEEGHLLYDGQVQVTQGPRNLRCENLTVELTSPGGKAEKMICRTQVEMVDPQAHRRVLGDVAVYTLAENQVEIFGKPVQLLDADDNKLEGKYLLYDVEAGTIQLKSQIPEGRALSP